MGRTIMSTPFHSSSNTTPDAPTGTSNVAIVTGASSGSGLEVTKRLAAKGYRVVANSRNITSAMTLQATGLHWSAGSHFLSPARSGEATFRPHLTGQLL